MSIEPTVETFAQVVRSYCEWAECDFGDPLYELRRARLLLAELHLAAIQLPLLGEASDEEPDGISDEDWTRFLHKFRALPLDGYWDVFNPLDETEPGFNSLADDLADIYRNLKEGLSLFDAGHPTEAVWNWRILFHSHWGQHLVGAQRALHEYLSQIDL